MSTFTPEQANTSQFSSKWPCTPSQHNHTLILPTIIASNLKNLRRQLPNIRILNALQSLLDILQSLRLQPLPVLRIHIKPRRRKKRLRKLRHNPLISRPVLLTPAQNLPMAARDHEQPFPSPIPFASAVAGARAFVYAVDCGDFVAFERLVGDQVVESIGVFSGDGRR